jgi:hypothetical protein
VKAEPPAALPPVLPVLHPQQAAVGAAEGAPYCSSPLKRLALAPPAGEAGVAGSPLKRACRPPAPLLPEPPSFNTLIAGEASEEDLMAWAAGGGSSGALAGMGSSASLNGLLTARTGSCPLGSYLELPAVFGGEGALGAGGGAAAAPASGGGGGGGQGL